MSALFPWWPLLSIPLPYFSEPLVIDFTWCEQLLQMLVPYFTVAVLVWVLLFVYRVIMGMVGGDSK